MIGPCRTSGARRRRSTPSAATSSARSGSPRDEAGASTELAATSSERSRAAFTGVGMSITIVAYDPEWPREFERERDRLRAALGDRALRIEHHGSTAVP